MANTTVRMDLIGKVDTQPPFSLTGIHNKSTMDDSRTSSAADVKPSSSSSSAAAAATSLSSEGAKHNQQQQPSVPTFEESFEGVARLLRDKKNILALVGAGISTSIGIPDFRSKDGIYHSEELQALGLSAPEDLFDMEFFEHNPAPFYRFARNLYRPQSKPLWTTAMTKTRTKTAAATTANATTTSTTIRPSDSHKFLALLEKRKMLLRVYTQNIDGLEEMAGVSEKKVVYAHGSIRYAKCLKCKKRVSSEQIMDDIVRGSVARCRQPINNKKQKKSFKDISPDGSNGNFIVTTRDSSKSVDKSKEKTTINETSTRQPSERLKNRARSISSTSDESTAGEMSMCNNDETTMSRQGNIEGVCGGVMKPAITFFGEALGDTVSRSLEADRKKVDAVIVIGTSLSVAPISKVIEFLPPNVPRILINRNLVHPPSFSMSTTTKKANTGSNNNQAEDDEGADELDFRGSEYFFDAYLLGFCDDVTRCLAKQLFLDVDCSVANSPDRKKQRKAMTEVQGNSFSATTLASALLESDNECLWNQAEWRSVTVPHERVILFPGAEARSHSAEDASSSDDIVYGEIAYCDGCSKQIHGTIYKCTVCFDYDLCHKCHKHLSMKHCDGTHAFAEERY